MKGPTQNYGDAAPGTQWRSRPALALLVRATSSLGPLVVALVVGAGAAQWLPATRTGLPWPVWLLLVVGTSTGVLVVLSRWLRGLLPLSALLRLSLVLPDRVPSRFEVARRTWTPAALEGDAAPGGEVVGAEGGAAQRLLALVGTLAGHDARTRAHGERVQAYAALIGRELGLSDDDVDRLSWVALLHDVGKVHVPVEIINKDGRPTEEEWATLQQHPHHGGELVQPLRGWLGDWLDGVEQHHERWDGGGYPRGLAGQDISLAARVIAVADTYDVITSARAYKKPMPAEQARAEITRCAGEQFDPEVVRAFLSVGIGRLRRIAGPATLLAALPGVGVAPAQALSTAASVAQTAGGQVAAAVLSAAVGVGAGSAAVAVASTPAAAVEAAPASTASPAEVAAGTPRAGSATPAPRTPSSPGSSSEGSSSPGSSASSSAASSTLPVFPAAAAPSPSASSIPVLPGPLPLTAGPEASPSSLVPSTTPPARGTTGPRPAATPGAATRPAAPASRTTAPTAGGASAVKPSTGAPKPKPSTGASKPKPSTGASKPKPSTGASKPKPSTGASKPKPSTGASKPKPSTGASKPKPSTGTPKPKPSTGTPKPKPSEPAGPKPKPSEPAGPKPEPSEPAGPKPEPSTGAPKPEPSTGAPKPGPSTAAPEPTGAPEPPNPPAPPVPNPPGSNPPGSNPPGSNPPAPNPPGSNPPGSNPPAPNPPVPNPPGGAPRPPAAPAGTPGHLGG
ncbi:HD domain-containing phosphohydrolase [Kineococcus radiotolerans]|uniref:HD domain-containing phosphohydrolase n=1 Tax=Kineococcus radiotolerans TaxID=131568 RepID=UPI000676A47C|nr:HD domain-containing phosphohydrolase [Kineococcus radiotolerans]